MNRQLPNYQWTAALKELKALRQRGRMTGLPLIDPLLVEVQRSLVSSCNPQTAGNELRYIADYLRAYPHLRESVMKLSRQLLELSADVEAIERP